ncbi:MAG TPA: DUF1570 domain-containing protein [Acidobacteriaceae bacterium]|jgi:tetratricopeptide (TPR) repeat protein
MRTAVSKLILMLSIVLWAGGVAAGASPSSWTEVRSAHFVVMTDAGERDGIRVASQFERMYQVFHTLFLTKGEESDPPIVVLAVKSRKGMETLEPEAYLGKGKVDLSGFFVRATDKNYILVRLDAKGERAFSTVYHEYTHYMLRKAEWLPLWLNEGLAQFYENTDVEEKSTLLGRTNTERLRYLNRNELLPIATLLRINSESPYYHDEQKGSVFYAESWALTHYLIVSDRMQGTHRIRDYAQLLSHGEDAVTAAQHAFGDLGALEGGLSNYLMQRRFMYFTVPATQAETSAAFEVRSISTATADALRADVLINTGRRAAAQSLLEEVLRNDPGNAMAHEAMGTLRYSEGNMAGAQRWYGAAAKLNPESGLAHYYFAMTAMHGGSGAEDVEVESSLRAAIRLSPGFAPAYDALATFYVSRHRQLDEAYSLNVRAMELEPESLRYRVDCAEVLTEQRQFESALKILDVARRLARTPYEVDAVQSRIARVERYEVAQAGTRGRTLDVSLPIRDDADRNQDSAGGAGNSEGGQ